MDSDTGIVSINDVWLRKVWQLCCCSSTRTIKVQEKKNVIYNIRPATWYTDNPEFPVFDSLEDFLSALDQLIYIYPQTRATIANTWKHKLKKAYKNLYDFSLEIPHWEDIRHKYLSQKYIDAQD